MSDTDRPSNAPVITVGDVRRELADLPDDAQITFGMALIDSPLRWFRLSRRRNGLHVELIEDLDFDLTTIGPAPVLDDPG
jgi:hypothetical protein